MIKLDSNLQRWAVPWNFYATLVCCITFLVPLPVPSVLFQKCIVFGTVNTFFCDLSGMELLFIQTPHTSSRKGVMTIVDPLHWLRNAVHVATALQQFVV